MAVCHLRIGDGFKSGGYAVFKISCAQANSPPLTHQQIPVSVEVVGVIIRTV